jgi:hypothetical protein
LNDEQTDDAAAEHDDGGTRFDPGQIDAVQAAGERLAEGATQRIEAERQFECLFPGDDRIFGKAAIAMDAYCLEVLAEIDAPPLAFGAAAAGDVRVAGHAHAGTEICDA